MLIIWLSVCSQGGTGTIAASEKGAVFTLPIEFPTKQMRAVACDTGGTAYAASAGSYTKTTITLWRSPVTNTSALQYITFGY